MFGANLLGELVQRNDSSIMHFITQRNRIQGELQQNQVIEKALSPDSLDPESIQIFEYLNNVRKEEDQQLRVRETISLFANYFIDKNIKGQTISMEKLIEIIVLLIANP